jgi:predicted MFS family arabinose efflux permease
VSEEDDRRPANYALAALFVVYIFNFVDRQILATLLQPIKEELGASDTQMGLLAGLAFALFYTFLGIPIARFADRGSRVLLISLGLVVWSAMTATSSYARTFVQLALARIGVGVGEASFTPSAHSLITDYFPPARRATAMAIFTIGANVGTFLAQAGGGWVAHNVGWRPAFLMVGLPGLLIALVFYRTVREPLRGRWDPPGSTAPIALREAFAALASRRSFVFIALSAALHGFSSYGSGTWTNVFLMRVHGLNVAQAGLVLGTLTAVVAASGTYAVGRLTDRLGMRDARWYMWITAAASILALPFVLLFLYLGDPVHAVVAYLPGQLLVSSWVGPTYAMTQSVAPPSTRALAAAIVVFAINLVGMGLGPVVVGALNDALAPRFGLEAVRYSLMIAAIPHTLAAVFNVLAARTLREDLARAAGPAAQAP